MTPPYGARIHEAPDGCQPAETPCPFYRCARGGLPKSPREMNPPAAWPHGRGALRKGTSHDQCRHRLGRRTTAVGSFLGSSPTRPRMSWPHRDRAVVENGARVDKVRMSARDHSRPGADAAQGQKPGAGRRISTQASPQESAAWGTTRSAAAGLRAVAEIGRAHTSWLGPCSIVVAGRAGENMFDVAPCPPPSPRGEDGRHDLYRHDDPRRLVGRASRLSHGPDGRECRPAVADQPRDAGRVRRASQNKARSRPKGGALRRRDRGR